MGMIVFNIGLKHKTTGEILTFKIKANNGSECIGRIVEGKAKFPYPKDGDTTKLIIQSFIPDGNWIIERMDSRFDYPEMIGKVI